MQDTKWRIKAGETRNQKRAASAALDWLTDQQQAQRGKPWNKMPQGGHLVSHEWMGRVPVRGEDKDRGHGRGVVISDD